MEDGRWSRVSKKGERWERETDGGWRERGHKGNREGERQTGGRRRGRETGEKKEYREEKRENRWQYRIEYVVKFQSLECGQAGVPQRRFSSNKLLSLSLIIFWHRLLPEPLSYEDKLKHKTHTRTSMHTHTYLDDKVFKLPCTIFTHHA